MEKMAVIFVNGAQEDAATLLRQCVKACLKAYTKQLGLFGKKTADFDIETAHVLDIQTVMQIKYNVDKYGINNFLATNDEKNPDPRKTVLAVRPADPEKLNKMSAGLRLF